MRAILRTAIIIGGAAALAVVVLLAVAAVTGSWVPAVAAAVLGAGVVIAGSVLAVRAVDHFSTTANTTATRLKNAEARYASGLDHASQVEKLVADRAEEIVALGGRLDQLDGEIKADSRQITAAQADAASLREALTGAEEAVTRIQNDSEQDRLVQDQLRSSLHELQEDSSSLALRVDAGAAETAKVHKSVRNLAAALERTRTPLERVRRDVRNLRARVPAGFSESVDARMADIGATTEMASRMAFEAGIQLQRDPHALLTPQQAKKLFDAYLRDEQYVQLKPLIESFDLLSTLNLAELRGLYRFYRTAGYWNLALRAITILHQKSGRDNDGRAAAKLQSEITVFSEPTLITTELPDGDAYDPTGPVLHMVGRVLPETQTGYTLRTHYTAQAQARSGLSVAIVGQSGITDRSVEDIEQYTHQGIDYFLLPGAARSQMLLDDWLRSNMVQLGELVRRLRPSVLQAHSDFFNALIVKAVGDRYGIPTVYESRGFWEESWLSRTITAHQWTDPEALFAAYGLPEAYSLRKRAEETARLLPDHVFTLANVMREHIVESANGALDPKSISIVPNAVDAQSFPVQEPDGDLAAQIGIPDGAVTVGYISSIVEYEGIDTLIDAFDQVAAQSDKPMRLLLVGDGNYLPVLKKQVELKGIEGVIFTGRVPHEDVLRYYGLIDIFVVPRKPSRVADLVTPLKPFEAFATGRAVVLSDVGALKEIAGQSAAVDVFKAGSAADLARVLSALVDDPDRRRALGEKAARWVRSHRVWEVNSVEYLRVFRALGHEGEVAFAARSEMALVERGESPGEILNQIVTAQLPPLNGWFSIGKKTLDAEGLLSEGWKFSTFEPVPVATLTDWSAYSAVHRTWGFRLHSWEFIDPLLRAYDESADEMWLREAARIGGEWVEFHERADGNADPMVWYDMAQSLRLPRLIALTFRVARIADLRDRTLLFVNAIARHLDELQRDDAFNPNNNHGFYTAASQVHAAKYAWMFEGAKQSRSQGDERLKVMIANQFASDGIHREHSPDYHRMLLASFEEAVRDGLITDKEVQSRLMSAAHALGWMVQPDGALVQFGDSPERKVTRAQATSIDPETRYLLTEGAEGERPGSELGVFKEGGFAFVRSPQPDGPGKLAEAGYLAFSASFHSRAHKHADDLNVVWYDRGQQILVDGGRFGYGDLLPADSPLRQKGFYYGSKERQYVEGTMAHNTLMMDGEDQDRRDREPYGSGIESGEETNGRFDLSGRVRHTDYVHRRRIVYTPGAELLLLDSVFSNVPQLRNAVLWFNFDSGFNVELDGNTVYFEHPQNGLRLTATSDGHLVEPVRGQQDPMRGWRSRVDQELEPAWSLGFAFDVNERASVTTRMKLS